MSTSEHSETDENSSASSCAPKPPLNGIRVLDLTNVLAGPFCCHQLVHLGAEVIKLERPKKGDLARELGADAALNARLMGASFLAQNAGKKSITIDPRQKLAEIFFVGWSLLLRY